MYLYYSNHLRGPAAAAGARTWHQCKHSPAAERIAVVIPGVDPVSATAVEDRHYAGLDTSRIDVKRIPCSGLNRKSKLNRISFYCGLMWRQFVIGMREPGPQAVISMSLPLSMLLVARLVAWLRRLPLIVDVRDLPFDVAKEVGYARFPRLADLFARMEAGIVRTADVVFTVSPRFRSVLGQRGCRNVFYNPIGFDNFAPEQADLRYARPTLAALFAGAGVDFIVVSAGTFGHVTEVNSLLQAAERLREKRNIGFLLVGDGQNLDRYKRQVEKSGANVRFLGRVSKSAIAQICRNADAAYYGSSGGFYTNAMLGNKVFDFMGAGLPVIYHGPDSAVRDILLESDCAVLSAPDDMHGLVGNIVGLAASAAKSRRLGENARRAVNSRFLAEKSARDFWQVIQSDQLGAETV
jgi:glycosyltransferase involved in cell wall biosynthesis